MDLEKLNTYKSQIDIFQRDIREYIQDKSIDVDKRWEVFLKAGKLGMLPVEEYIQHFEGEIEEWIDKYVLDDRCYKHMIVTAWSCLNLAIDDEKDKGFQNELKEQWMEKFIYSFNFDW